MTRDSDRIYDELLVASARIGDRAALSRLAARWHPRLLRYAWRVLGDRERAKDAVQEAWLEIVRGIVRLDDVAAFPAWAFRIVTRRCQRMFQRFADPAGSGVELPDAAGASSESASGERAAELAIVLAAMRSLSRPQRAALELFYVDDLSVAEIAVATDVPPGTVKTRLMHARRKVREILEGSES